MEWKIWVRKRERWVDTLSYAPKDSVNIICEENCGLCRYMLAHKSLLESWAGMRLRFFANKKFLMNEFDEGKGKVSLLDDDTYNAILFALFHQPELQILSPGRFISAKKISRLDAFIACLTGAVTFADFILSLIRVGSVSDFEDFRVSMLQTDSRSVNAFHSDSPVIVENLCEALFYKCSRNQVCSINSVLFNNELDIYSIPYRSNLSRAIVSNLQLSVFRD